MGRRFLRMSIIQPLNIIETINVRLSAVSVLIANPIILMKIREHLELISDLQLKIASLSRANTDTLTSLRLIVELKRALESCSNIKDTIKDLNCELLDGIQSAFSNDKTQNILKMIDGVVDILPDGKLNEFQMCHILRAETNPLLDVARRTLQETTDDIIAYSETLISQFNLEGRLKYLNSNRFVLVLSNPTVEQAKLFSKFGNNGYSTLELQKLNERVKESMEEITSLSDSIVKSLCDSINESVGALFVLCEALALLDFVCGLAHYAIEFDCIRPEFTENTEVLINDGLHPFISDPKPVSFSIGGFSRFVIITGANMSGKSTLIRQAALYQIMVFNIICLKVYLN